ncbi:hypothetical protein NW762_012037 [Fusarium torreyae]|uniref:Uncharacterized protein n=1 Tax=Fusarium torreyae TaxID=1237075 RepID=A0A9W8RS43_9HYPO|nr:hypothetical protein NW762_012037 [Fusarium torreyae]
MAYNSLFSQRGLPFFLADQAVGDILQELAAEHLADREAKQFVKNCLKTISPGDKEFLALFRWRVEAVPLGGKPTVRILPHIISPELRSAIIKDLIRYQSWGPINGFEWQSISDAWSRNGDLVFARH